ncbi:hypothetical protein WP12_15740 [Sphingomonas sp. SRS2]|nr:hypothetical protein WP12_15740 [Sphingomonas sp. SRS2]
MFQRLLFHLACVLALAWPAFVNGQPFYFPDTTTYTRAADSAAYIFSGHRISTEWTDRYRHSLDPGGKIGNQASHVSPNVNDLGTESVMAGRSPYFGALLWLSYVFTRFWLFVLAQAAVAYALIRVTLRLFDLAQPLIVAASVAALALLTSLPFFVSLLMPDLLAAFGILAFLLLAIERKRLGRGERWSLYALMLVSALAHITHILIISALAVTLFAWALFRGWRRSQFAPLIGGSSVIALVGVLSVMFTATVVERTFGRAPLLVPLLTARFLADGTGLDYVRRHCPAAGFAACAYRDREEVIVGEFLWSLEPGKGAYMIADTATRRALSTEDSRFALAVLMAYPVEQGGRLLRNGWRQMLRFDIDLLDYKCRGKPDCWSSLPPVERSALLASPGGRDLWPQDAIAAVHYTIVGLSLVLLLAWVIADARMGREGAGDIFLWLVLLSVALAGNALLGGGVSDPQPRYQARVMWLLLLLATIAGLVWYRRGRAGPAAG